MKKLYKVKVNTEEQLGLSGERFLTGIEVLDSEKNLENQIRENYLKDYHITIIDVEFSELNFKKYNIIIEEKKGYVIVLHNCKNGSERIESKFFEEMPTESLVKEMTNFFGAEKATIEER
jgi:hypothetical protein